MFVFVGLGNPGEEYARTRHNTGFLLADALAQVTGGHWENQRKVLSLVARTEQALLVKPQTYMNESGVAVQKVVSYYKLAPDMNNQLWVGFDDLDLPFGSFKIQFGRGPKVHNGLLSVYQHFGTDQFWHVRIGADSRAGDRSLPGSSYVLQPFTSEEQDKLLGIFTTIINTLQKELHPTQPTK